MPNSKFNTILDIYQTANSSATKRNTEALLNAAIEQNQQILELRQQLHVAQEQANRFAAKQLDLQLKEAVAKQEQKFLRKFVFTFETAIEEALQLSDDIAKYVFLNFDILPVVGFVEDAVEKLDNLDDKRSARNQLKILKENQDLIKKYEKDYQNSSLCKFRKLAENFSEQDELPLPEKAQVPKVVYKKYKRKYGIPAVIAAIMTIVKTSQYILTPIEQWDSKFLFIEFVYGINPTIILPGYFAFVRYRNYKPKDQIEKENQELKDEYEKSLEEAESTYKEQMKEYEKIKFESDEKLIEHEDARYHALEDFPEYFRFQNYIIKQFSAEKFNSSYRGNDEE
ncbi:hypothetical protein [Leptospira idonii]|uniref:Uncharacterized protein n=1 Tax=Leptospira idonii TaxID=1193500 RepID=A0A4R9LXD7_9LEPT|nr:hypothetical protein [Leptospira idonii]TGN16941.1 hypothetical protein EHS15_18805 [Leptospira idonii]